MGHFRVQHLEVFENEIIKGKNPMHKLLFVQSEKYGLPVITHNTPFAHTPFYSVHYSDWDLSETDLLRVREPFSLVSKKWMECLSSFCDVNGVGKRDFIGFGLSNGAQWISRLAMLYPEYFYSVDSNIPCTCPTPSPEGKHIHWSQVSGVSDSGYPHTSSFYNQAITLDYQNIYLLAPHKLNHGNWMGIKGVQRFRAAFYDHILANGKTARPIKPLYVGDFINNVVSPIEKSGWIPENQKVFFPSLKLASSWGNLKGAE